MTANRPRMSRGVIPEQGEREGQPRSQITGKLSKSLKEENVRESKGANNDNTDVDHVLSSKEIHTARYQPA